MWEKWLVDIIDNHLGKAIGLFLGLIAGILIITYGFWQAIFIVLCVLLGFAVGKIIDENTSFSDWMDKFRGR